MILPEVVQEARDSVDATSTSYPDATLLRRLNNSYEDVAGIVIAADGTWQFDDTNYTTNPIGVATMVEGQSAYSFSTTFLDLLNVKIMDLQGHWHILKPWDQSESHIPIENYQITPAFPRLYDKQGNTIKLLPPPTGTVITLTNGLKLEFKRTMQLFTLSNLSDSTVIPGFASPYHLILAYKAALPYAAQYKKDRVPWLNGEITRLTNGILAFYGHREEDKRKKLVSKGIRHR